MHDPMVVAYEIPSLIPKRARWKDAGNPGATSVRRNGERRPVRRWGWTRSRRTNDANLGQLTYSWWRLRGLGPLRLAGYAFELGRLATIWHVEPDGRDSGSVCKHTYGSRTPLEEWPARWKVRWLPWYRYHPGDPHAVGATKPWVHSSAWKFHVHHWRIQFHPLGRAKRRLATCCTLCGRPYRRRDAVMSHQWDSDPVRWRDWIRTRRRVEHGYHEECSSLVMLRGDYELAMTALDRIDPSRLYLETQLGIPFTPAFNIEYRLKGWRERLEKEWEQLPPADRLLLGTRQLSTLHGRDLALVLHNVIPSMKDETA